jgi:hypothetical protein
MQTLHNPAKLFLQHYLELQGLMDDSEIWEEKHLEYNPPRYYRLCRINACMKALGLEINNWANLREEFLQLSITSKAKEQLEDVLAKQFELDYASYLMDKDTFNSGYMLNMLLKIRVAIFQLSVIHDTVLAASNHYITPLLIISRLNKKLESDNTALDEAITLLLNPNNIQLTLEELADCFGYPVVDLDEIDLDWI